MRPLTLHASALTDSEYALYTDALLDLAGEDALAAHPHDDSYYAALAVSAREARAWIRGRYTGAAVANGALEPAQVDAVLKLFCPNLAPADTLNGGQFFAALRLVTHLRHGKPLDGSLVFVQAHPDDASSPPVQNASPPLIATSTVTDSPAQSRRTSREIPDVITKAPAVPPKPSTLPPLPPTPSSSTNPFINRTKSHEPPTLPQPALPTLRSKTQPPPPPTSQPVIPPLPPRKPTGAADTKERPPPPPPRHSSAAPPNAPAVLTPGAGAGSPFAFWHSQSYASAPGGTPTHPHVLMQQSLQAGRIAQSLKRAEAKLEKERVLEVLKSSSSAPSNSATSASASAAGAKDGKRTRSESPSKGLAALALNPPAFGSRSYSVSSGSSSSSRSDPPVSGAATPTRGPALPPRRRVSPPASAWSGRSARSEGGRSIGSLREVANAAVAGGERRSMSRERRCSPPPQHPALVAQPAQPQVPPPLTVMHTAPAAPPPTHPGRKPPPPVPGSATSAVFLDGPGQDRDEPAPSPTSRVFRSKSMHQPASPASASGPPVPPRPRRRPESVQYRSSFDAAYGTGDEARPPSPAGSARTERSARSANTVLSSPASLPARGGHVRNASSAGSGVSRHLSLSLRGAGPRTRRADSAGAAGEGGMAQLKDGLKDRILGLQPKIDAARYKAEAGLSRRGFVNYRSGSVFREEGEERLVDESDEEGDGEGYFGNGSGNGRRADGVGEDAPTSVDVEESEDERGPGGRGRERRAWEVERDEMKWPVAPGEGWAPL